MLLMNETLEILILNILVELSAAVGRRFMNFVIKQKSFIFHFLITKNRSRQNPKITPFFDVSGNSIFSKKKHEKVFLSLTKMGVLKSDKTL